MLRLKKPSFTLLFIAVLVCITPATAVFYSKLSFAADKAATQPKPALTITTAQPVATRLPTQLAANGNIAAWQEAIIGSETNGLRLLEVRAHVGDSVTKGQVLATFAVETVQAELAQSRASVLEAEANFHEAAGNADKARTLQATGALSEQQINQYITLGKTANARLEMAKAAQAVQRVRLAQTQLRAPDNGVISSRSATVGAVVGSGVELFRMVRGGRLEWRAEVTSNELSRLRVGTPVRLLAANGTVVEGKTRMIGPVVDPQTRMGLVYVDLPAMYDGRREGPPQARPAPSGLSAAAPDVPAHIGTARRASGSAASTSSAVREATSVGALLPGMFARGEFELGATDSMTVPQRAVVVRDGFSYVFKLGSDNRVSRLKVQTGRLAGDRIEVVSGLNQEARIAVDGAGFLNDGDVVRVIPGIASNSAAPTPSAVKSGAAP